MQLSPTLVGVALAAVLAGCSAGETKGPASREALAEPAPTTAAAPAPPSPAPEAPSQTEGTDSSPTPAPSAPTTAVPPRAGAAALASDGRPRRAALSIPAIGVHDLRVVPYRGTPDDAPGTRLQDGGVAASPHGSGGGVGPGGVGNYIVTAHRTSSTRAFYELPSVRVGDRVHVEVRGSRYTYRVVGTRKTSFRSRRSLAEQSAPVPGHPGREPRRAMITLSTCATPEDHAQGNYWSDEFGNPEHRIDKIGVLVARRPA